MQSVFLKQLWRRIVREKTYTLLNIVGLSAGLTCFVFIALWVNDELSYDKFNQNYDRIVRLTTTQKTETGVSESARTSAPMAKALLNDYEEVENTVRLLRRGEIVLHHNTQKVLMDNSQDILLTDPSFFDVFSYRLTRGNVVTALKDPYSIILTESTAKKYFGNADPMGQSLLIPMYNNTGRGANYKITGIMPDPPANTHFIFTMLASFNTIEADNPDVLTADGWTDGNCYTYLLLKKGVDYETFSGKISLFYEKHVGDRFNSWRSVYSYKLQPLRDIHLKSHLEREIIPNGNISQVYIFSSVGIFILMLAGINYTNLATARSAGRAKEIGIKKVVGALKSQLMLQYLSESVFITMLALLLSLLISFFIQPFFYQVTGKNLSLFSSPFLLLFLAGISIFLGIVSGIYPAVILSGFKPAGILKGAFKSGTRGVILRESLTISQFVITIILITGIVVIHAQMTYIKHKDLGYNKDALVFLRINGNIDVVKGYAAFKNELVASPLVTGIATSNSSILNGVETGSSETIDSKGRSIQVNTSQLEVDADYVAVYELKMIAGENFVLRAAGDTIRQIIVNESAVKKFGWGNPENAIGKPFTMNNQPGTITGVIKDFHFNSLQHHIEPLAIYPRNDRFSKITLKVDGKNADQSLAFIQKVWVKHFRYALFDYDFLDVQVEEQYRSEERFSTIILYFSILSLLIACIGLYGLIAYSTSQKTKEIGIRKTLGATVNGIVIMLSKDFLKLVVFAGFIAVPAVWYIMTRWLQDFAYRISISWWMFAVSISLVLFIALITVSLESIKAALIDPVKALRSE